MNPVAGWYPDPADAARLRWWDGSGWTDHTRDHQTHRAPPPPGAPGASAPPPPATPATPAPGAPPPPPPAASSNPGTFGSAAFGHGTEAGSSDPANSATSSYGSSPYASSSYSSPPWASSATSAGAGSAYGTSPYGTSPYGGTPYGAGTGAPGRAGAASAEAGSNRAWLSWASIGAAIAVALAVIIVLSISLLGHKTASTASQGVAPPATDSGSTTTAAPTTTLAPPPPDSTVFNDPAGVYSISINTAWETPAVSTSGVQLWYLTGVNYSGFRADLNIVAQTLPAPMPLPIYVSASISQLSRVSGFHVGTPTDITLSDGSAASVIPYSAQVQGQSVQGEGIVTVRGTHAVTITVLAGTDRGVHDLQPGRSVHQEPPRQLIRPDESLRVRPPTAERTTRTWSATSR